MCFSSFDAGKRRSEMTTDVTKNNQNDVTLCNDSLQNNSLQFFIASVVLELIV